MLRTMSLLLALVSLPVASPLAMASTIRSDVADSYYTSPCRQPVRMRVLERSMSTQTMGRTSLRVP